MPSRIKAALFQLQPALGEPARNAAILAKAVAKAKADLCVFPELYLTGYLNRDLHRGLAEPLDGPLGKGLLQVAKRTGAHVVAGMPRVGERRGVVHNSSVLATPEGELHAYDKVYLPTFSVFEEDLYFGEGHTLPVARTSLGRVGMTICYDAFFPEVAKGLAMQGADILTCISASPTISRTYFERVLPARAIETTCFLLFTNLVGPQDTVTFWGGAKAFGPLGDLQAEGPLMREAVTTADLDPEELDVARAKRPVLRDSRPELLGFGGPGRGPPGSAALGEDAPLPRDLRLLEGFHGHLDPWLVAGLRLGKAARSALKQDGRRPMDVEADVRAPRKPPQACALDGLMWGSGCTPGRGTLRVEEGAALEGRFRAGGKVVRVRLRPAAARRIAALEEAGAGAALEVLAMAEADLVEVEG